MRTIRERSTTDVEYPQDLRGMGDALKQGSPHSVLLVCNLTDVEITSLASEFGCEISAKINENAVSVTTKIIEEGQFKKQILTLFGLSLVIASKNQKAQMKLYVSRQNEDHFSLSNHALSLDDHAIQTLKQASLRIMKQELNYSDIAVILDDIRNGREVVAQNNEETLKAANAR